MMKDIKNCFKLLKYGYQIKANIACAIIFVLMGIGFLALGHEQFVISIVYVYMAIMFLTQSMHMMMFSAFVGASPSRKKVEIRYIDILNVISGVVASVIVMLMLLISKPGKMDGTSIEALLIIGGWAAIILYVYMSMAFKTMIAGTIFFMITFLTVLSMSDGVVSEKLTVLLGGKVLFAIIIYIAEVVVGILLGHGIRRLLYRKNMSKLAMGAKLRMEQS